MESDSNAKVEIIQVGVAVQKLRHLAKGRDPFNFLLILGHFRQVFPDGLFDKQALGVLGQYGKAAVEQLRRLDFFYRSITFPR